MIYNPVSIRFAFNKGWQVFCDLSAVIGGHRALLALNNCMDICSRNIPNVRAKSNRIAMSPYINPDQRDGVDILIETLALEVVLCMVENGCLPDDRPLMWELASVNACKITVRPRMGAAPTHHFLGTAPVPQ